MKVLITGGDGMLAYAFKQQLETRDDVEVHSCDRDECDITDRDTVMKLFEEFKPDVVFNCAAYTAVDQAEEDLEAARAVNGTGARYVAEACLKHGSLLVHYSTDYVFYGDKESYDEEDERNPLNAYGVSKAEGEEAIEEVLGESGKYYIIRTAWLYGPHGANFVETMLRLGKERDELNVVNDQHGSPTLTIDLAAASIELVGDVGEFTAQEYPYGIYHMTNSGDCTWFEYTQEIFKLAGIATPVSPVTSVEFPRPAARPAYSVLNRNRGPFLRPWQDALQDYLDNYRN